jgi:hypothetical protein
VRVGKLIDGLFRVGLSQGLFDSISCKYTTDPGDYSYAPNVYLTSEYVLDYSLFWCTAVLRRLSAEEQYI